MYYFYTLAWTPQPRFRNRHTDGRFEAFTAVMFLVEVFWVVTPCSVVVGYQRFGGPSCLHLQGNDRTPTTVQFSASQSSGIPTGEFTPRPPNSHNTTPILFVIYLSTTYQLEKSNYVIWQRQSKGKKLSLCLTKYHAMKTYHLLN
jgi:hypothetical protein